MTEAVAASMAARAELTFCRDTSSVVCFHFTDACMREQPSCLCLPSLSSLSPSSDVHCRCRVVAVRLRCAGFPRSPGQRPSPPGCCLAAPAEPSTAEGSETPREAGDEDLPMFVNNITPLEIIHTFVVYITDYLISYDILHHEIQSTGCVLKIESKNL